MMGLLGRLLGGIGLIIIGIILFLIPEPLTGLIGIVLLLAGLGIFGWSLLRYMQQRMG